MTERLTHCPLAYTASLAVHTRMQERCFLAPLNLGQFINFRKLLLFTEGVHRSVIPETTQNINIV